MRGGKKANRPEGPHPVWGFLDRPITLVSTSPRRASILGNLGVPFESVPPGLSDEGGDGRDRPEILVSALARRKVESVRTQGGDRILLGADTVVVVDGRILEKPGDAEEAHHMLRELSGRSHRVLTGLFLLHESTGRAGESVEETRVHFRDLNEREREGYVRSGEPFDKAGGYGIQGLGGLFVERIEGCYFNVVGLPVTALGRLLRTLCGPADRTGDETSGGAPDHD